MRTDAIILYTQPWREHDLLVACYTERAGLVRAVAKGALKDSSVQRMHLNQGQLVRFDLVPGKGIPIVTGAFGVETFSNIRSNLARQAAAWNLLESVSALVTEQEQDEQLFHTLRSTLYELNTCEQADVLPALRRSQRDTLAILGYTPQMNSCGVCTAIANGGPATFSVELGSIVCSSCTNSGWYGAALSGEDRRWFAGEKHTAPCAKQMSRGPTEQLLEYISGRRLRSSDLLFGALQT